MSVAERQQPLPGELALDHLAHFVTDLDAAASVFESVGMKVTPLSVHKVNGKLLGTSNRCVMLEEGYLELLSGAAGKGIRLACFGTPDAEAEHHRLADHGFEPRPLVPLSRRIAQGLLRFKVAIGSRMPEGRIQYVQHLTPGLLWQKRYVNPLRLQGLFVKAANPAAVAARWAQFTGLIPQRTASGIRLEMARGWVLVAKQFPWKTPAAPALAGYQLGCRHPKALAARCRKAGLEVNKFGSRYRVMLPAALGGVWVI